MLKDVLKEWSGTVDIDGEVMTTEEASSKIDFKTLQTFQTITLLAKRASVFKTQSDASQSISNTHDRTIYEITVKPYMTQKATPEFDFMEKWNHDVPMPLATMVGWEEKETRGMVYMHLHGVAKPTINCLCCGRELTNPISRKYGIGPICLGKVGITLDIDDIEGITEKLVETNWEGWIIKSAIITKLEVNQND